jgi:nucleoid DNA-binding protein
MNNKQDLVSLATVKLAETTKLPLPLSNAEMNRIVDAVTDAITELSYNGGLRITGLGTFKVKRQAARKGSMQGKDWQSPEKDVLRFKAGKRKI